MAHLQLELIAAALRAHSGRYYDKHKGANVESTKRAAAIALHKRFNRDGSVMSEDVVLLHTGDPQNYPYYSVNPLKLQSDGMVALQTGGFGTVRNAAGNPIEEHIEQYNRAHNVENIFFHAEISDLTRI